MELKTINIRGKEYVQVNERIKAFRSLAEYKGWSLVSEIVELKEDACTIKATISDDTGRVVATGYAREVIGKSPINKFAFVENCETSAWGRALGNLGFGIDTAICSAEEISGKMSQDDTRVDFDSLQTKEDFLKAVHNCSTVKQLNALYWKWKDKDFAKEIQKASSDRKLALENPEANVEERNPSVIKKEEVEPTGPNDYMYDDLNY